MEAARALFDRQDGVATTAQLAALGVPAGVVRQRVATGEWSRVAAGIVCVPGSSGWRVRARIALLAVGPHAGLSHGTAGRVHGFDGFDRFGEIHLVVPGLASGAAPPGAVVHRSRSLSTQDIHQVGGLAVVIRPLALVQIAASAGRDVAGKALDGMLRNGDRPEWIRQVAERWRRPGMVGPATVLELLAERIDTHLPRSWFQRVVARVLAERAIRMVDEFPVADESGRVIAHLDLALPELRIGVECQSWRWHATPSARAADARRKRRLRQLGWEIVEVWWTDLDRPDDVADDVLALVRARRGQ